MRIENKNPLEVSPSIRETSSDDLKRINDSGIKHVHELVFRGVITPKKQHTY